MQITIFTLAFLWRSAAAATAWRAFAKYSSGASCLHFGQWQLFCSVQPEADELPFAVALELHRRGSGCATEASSGSHSPAQQSSYQLHYVLQGQAQVPTCLNGSLVAARNCKILMVV